MLVIALHGFGMTGDGDELCQDIVKLANDNGDVGLAPTYPANNPHLAHLRLTEYVETKMRDYNSDAIFVGAALGGFWARHLTKTFGAKRLVLINPALSPWESLQPYVGQNRNFCNNEHYELSNNDANAYYIYRGDDSKLGVEKTKTLFIATEGSNQHVIDIFAGKRNVSNHIVKEYDDILSTIKDELYSEEDSQ